MNAVISASFIGISVRAEFEEATPERSMSLGYVEACGMTDPLALIDKLKSFGRFYTLKGSREPTYLTGHVFLRFKAQMPNGLRRVGKLSDTRPGLLVVRNDELIDAGRDDVALDAVRIREQHERLFTLR